MTQFGMPVPQNIQPASGKSESEVTSEHRPLEVESVIEPERGEPSGRIVASNTLVISPEDLQEQYAQWHNEIAPAKLKWPGFVNPNGRK